MDNFSKLQLSVVAVVAVIYGKTAANGQLLLLKSYPNWPLLWMLIAVTAVVVAEFSFWLS